MLTHVGFRAHVKTTSRIVSYRIEKSMNRPTGRTAKWVTLGADYPGEGRGSDNGNGISHKNWGIGPRSSAKRHQSVLFFCLWQHGFRPRIPTHRTCRAVLSNGHTGHVPKAPGFFSFWGAPNSLRWNNLVTLIILLPSQRSAVRETR